MIEVSGVSKSYGGSAWAVRDVSFRVERGEVVGFLGPNGAGKTTTLRIVAGFLGATAGRVTVAGHDVAEDGLRARASVGYMPEAVPLYPEMRAVEYLRFRAELKGVPRARRRAAVARAMDLARVADAADKLVGHLSRGYRQRLGLADALVASPPVLVLDEPTSGLDPNQIREARDLVRELGREHAVLLSTHILPEVESICDRAVVIAGGRLVAQGTIEELYRLRRAPGLRIVVGRDEARAAEIAGAVEGVASARREGGAIAITWTDATEDTGAAAERVVAALVGAGVPVREAGPVRASLEEVFSALTADGGAA